MRFCIDKNLHMFHEKVNFKRRKIFERHRRTTQLVNVTPNKFANLEIKFRQDGAPEQFYVAVRRNLYKK